MQLLQQIVTNKLEIDKTKKPLLPKWAIEILFSVLVFGIIFVSYIVFKPLQNVDGMQPATISRAFGVSLCFILLISFIILCAYKKISFETTVFLILLLGTVIRLTYMLYTPGNCRQYDTWTGNYNGHYDYAASFYATSKLPQGPFTEKNIYQFYHPPLNAFIQGNFMKLFESINSNVILETGSISTTTIYEYGILYQSCQILSCFYMFVTALFFTKIVLNLNVSNSAKLIGVSFVNLFPRLVQLSGQLNNDALAIMFCSIALYFFFKWVFVKKSFLNNCLTALFIGLSLFAKMSSASVCLGMAVIYIIEFVKSILKKDDSLPLFKLILQYVVFILIAGGIGLWWQVYLIKELNMPFNFVFNNLNSALFTGTIDWVKANKPESLSYYATNNSGLIYESNFYNVLVRYIAPFYIKDFETAVFCNAFGNYNILSYALRSLMFGEFSYWHGLAEALAFTSTLFVYLTYISVIVGIIYQLVCKIKFSKHQITALFIFAGIWIMYIYLQISMPYGCSMDSRYIVPIILPFSLVLSTLVDTYTRKQNKIAKFLNTFTCISAIMFLISTSLFYLSAI